MGVWGGGLGRRRVYAESLDLGAGLRSGGLAGESV